MIGRLLHTAYKNALISALATGVIVYEVFAHIPLLSPVGKAVGPFLADWLPIGLFLLLYFTFCKIRILELKPRTWHFVIQLIRTSIAAFMVLLNCHNPHPFSLSRNGRRKEFEIFPFRPLWEKGTHRG